MNPPEREDIISLYKPRRCIFQSGFTNGQISDLTDPTLSSVEQHGFDIGKEAARLLVNRLQKEEPYPPITKVIETRLATKGSSQR